MFSNLILTKKYGKKLKKYRSNLIMPSLALIVFLPVNVAFAEETATPNVTAEKENKTNESTLNWLENKDYIFAAERIPTNRWDTPANIYIITAEEIENNHYQTVSEALNHVNGILANDTVSLNGIKRVVLLIDGRRMMSTEVSATQSIKSDLSVIPSIKMIERIEIIKGGMTALYGSDAVGGIINVITKKGTRNETTFDVNTGSWKTHNYELTNQGVAGKFSWFVTGSLHKQGYYKNINNASGSVISSNYRGTEKYIGDYDRKAASIRLDNRFNDRSSLTLTGFYRSSDSSDYHSSSLSYNFKEGTATPGYVRYFRDYNSSYFDTIENTYRKIKMQGIEYQNGWEFGKHKIIAGFEYHKNKFDTTWAGITCNGNSSDTAAYIQDTVSIGNKLTIIPGVRFDHDSESGNNWSPKIAINYRADDKTKFYGSWGRVYNSPSNVQLYAVPNVDYSFLNEFSFLMYGNPNLKAEKGHTETIGMEHAFDDNTNISVNYFHMDMYDVIGWDLSEYTKHNYGDPFVQSTVNSTIQKRHGVEFNFNKKLSDKWSINLGYAHITGKDYMKYFTYYSGDGVENYEGYYKPNGYIVGLHYKCGAWRANLLANIGEGYEVLDTSVQPAKVVVIDFNAGYDIKDYLTIYARASNLTNQSYGIWQGDYSAPSRYFQVGAVCRF